jgi:hypothetical protein
MCVRAINGRPQCPPLDEAALVISTLESVYLNFVYKLGQGGSPHSTSLFSANRAVLLPTRLGHVYTGCQWPSTMPHSMMATWVISTRRSVYLNLL